MITIQDVYLAAKELDGPKKQSKDTCLSLQAAACSPQQSLFNNGLMTDIIRKYHGDLPDVDTLTLEFRAKGVLFNNNHLTAIYRAYMLEMSGLLNGLNVPLKTYQEQVEWRDHVYELFHPKVNGKEVGYGMGYKAISFAYFLMHPLTCEQGVLDRHHTCRKEGKPRVLGTRKAYLSFEEEMRIDRDVWYPKESMGVYGWYEWEKYRQEKHCVQGPVESHYALRPYYN